jgi:3-hydroxyisobutyrate dehydrogenase-like beta-hydroxyacid dehydrogenase
MLADPRASDAVVFGADGVLEGIKPGHAFVDSSTVDEHTGSRVAAALTEKEGRFLAAPVSGGWRDAAAGELLFICGGDKGVYDQVSPKGGGMDLMGHRHWFMGDRPADAARGKLMLQV